MRNVEYALTPATEEHEAWLEVLRRDVYRKLFDATWGGWDEARHQRHWAGCLASGSICVVEVDGQRAGMLQVFESENALEVGEVQVLPSMQGNGLGTRLLRDVMKRARGMEKGVVLSTGLQNLRAAQLYERLGFRYTGRTETHIHFAWEWAD